MKKEQISDALNMLNDDISRRPTKSEPMQNRSASGLNGELLQPACVWR